MQFKYENKLRSNCTRRNQLIVYNLKIIYITIIYLIKILRNNLNNNKLILKYKGIYWFHFTVKYRFLLLHLSVVRLKLSLKCFHHTWKQKAHSVISAKKWNKIIKSCFRIEYKNTVGKLYFNSIPEVTWRFKSS